VHNTLYATRAISKRANLLDASSVIEQAALDKYAFVRDAWLQRRLDLVYDGDPPREPDDEPTK
jgi:phospholipid-binding lipoprotein MlaA